MRRLPVVQPVPAEVVRRVYQRADAMLEEVRAHIEQTRGPVFCRAGCAHCCSRPVWAFDVEVAALVAAVRALSREVREDVHERVRTWRRRMGAAGIDVRLQTDGHVDGYVEAGVACPLLDVERGLCLVYEARPISCRGMMIVDEGRGAEVCADPLGVPLEVNPVGVLQMVFAVLLTDPRVQGTAPPTALTAILLPELLAEAWPLVAGTMSWQHWLANLRRRIPYTPTITKCVDCGTVGKIEGSDSPDAREVTRRCPKCGHIWTSRRRSEWQP